MNKPYNRLVELKQKIADVEAAISLLNWDQETYLPINGNTFRAKQIATLSGIVHEWGTSEELESLLYSLQKDTSLNERQLKNVAISLRDYEKAKKLSKELVERKALQISICYKKWIEARETKEFALFAPELQKLIDIKQEEARCYGFEGHIYNGLLSLYEESNTVEVLDNLFSGVKIELRNLMDEILKKEKPDNGFLHQFYPKDAQWNLSIELLKNIGYDFNRGRQDYVVHPFCTTISPDDVRITTKVDEQFLSPLIWGSIHEGGHALYEQGLPAEEYGMPMGQAISMAVHESQSRIWENNVGRSKHFWTSHFEKLKKYFPHQFSNLDMEEFCKGINVVEPSLIRIEADEITYHFHVMIRYEIEKRLMDGSLKAAEIPSFWNSLYKDYLGLEVYDINEGCLQDVHWSHGLFGYFPTYSQGSFMAAQWYAFAKKEIPDLNDQIVSGNCKPLQTWLQKNVHNYGRFYNSDELLRKVTGESLNLKYFMDYARDKYL